jgi:glyoxylase-like metal-dependent hydrolase (beta-lactamase superfamily II)
MIDGANEFEVIAIRYGSYLSTRAENYYRFSSYGEPDGPLQLDYYFWLIRRGSEVTLVDTGFLPEVGLRRGRNCLIDPLQALDQLGVSASEVTRVIATHFHYDHVGNLASFPNATIMVQRAELEFWTGPLADRFQFAQVVESREIAYVAAAAAEGRVVVLDGDAQIDRGIDVQLLGGHCPGQQIVVVSGTGRQIVLASDTLHFYDEADLDRPFALFTDLPDMYAGYLTLRALEASGAAVVAGHDPLVGERFPRVDGACGEFAFIVA